MARFDSLPRYNTHFKPAFDFTHKHASTFWNNNKKPIIGAAFVAGGFLTLSMLPYAAILAASLGITAKLSVALAALKTVGLVAISFAQLALSTVQSLIPFAGGLAAYPVLAQMAGAVATFLATALSIKAVLVAYHAVRNFFANPSHVTPKTCTESDKALATGLLDPKVSPTHEADASIISHGPGPAVCTFRSTSQQAARDAASATALANANVNDSAIGRVEVARL